MPHVLSGPPGPAGSSTGRRTAAFYLAATSLSTIGSALGALESTFIATTSDPSTGALRTTLMIVILLVAAALTVPFAPSLAARWGSQRLFAGTIFGIFAVWTLAGVAMLAGLPPYAVLLVATPFMGLGTGMSTVLAPLFARAFLSRDTMAGAYARVSVIMGVSWGVGALLGGRVFQESPPGVGVLSRGLLALPLAVALVALRPAGGAPVSPARDRGAWSAMVHHIRTPSPLRTVITLSCVVAVFALPYLSLIVPIAATLRQEAPVSGAGLMMAGTSVGEVLSPPLVAALQRRLPSLRAAAAAAMMCGATLLLFAIVSLSTSRESELAIWACIGVCFGAARYAAKALELDAAVNSGVADDEAVATVSFVKTAVAPAGLVLWSLLMTYASVESALLVGCVGVTLGAVLVWMRAPRAAAS